MELSRKNRTEFVACSNNVISQHGERSCFKGRTISGGDEENNKNCAVETLLTNTFSHKDLDLFRDSEAIGRSIFMVESTLMCPIPEQSKGEGRFCRGVLIEDVCGGDRALGALLKDTAYLDDSGTSKFYLSSTHQSYPSESTRNCLK